MRHIPVSTLLMRPFLARDEASVERLLPRAQLRPGQQLLVLSDVAADPALQIRGAAIVRRSGTHWFVVTAAVDAGWPPAARALVEQLRANAVSDGATTIVFAATCATDVLATVIGDGDTSVEVGGAAVMPL